MKSLEQQIAAAGEWLLQQAKEIPYGQIGVMLVLHAGKLSRVERSVTTKFQPNAVAQVDQLR
jgi:hypothetical protein